VKGFPNQVADLSKLALAMACISDLVESGADAKDYGIFGEALVRSGVAGTGHTPKPVAQYLREQRTKSLSNQSFRTTARGLRELFRLMDLIDDTADEIEITATGREIASFAGKSLDDTQVRVWRRVILNITQGGSEGVSHPYQVLLGLVGSRPGITRARCALALEANNDSPQELARIAALSDLPENEILAKVGVSKANFDNAKKVLPKFAEQLGDVIRKGQSFFLAVAPGRASEGDKGQLVTRQPAVPSAPRTSRRVTPDTIARAGTEERFDEVEIPPPDYDRADAAAAVAARADRLRRHNLLVRKLASCLDSPDEIHEDPFDILAIFATDGILIEVKTLDGTLSDERERVRDALGQLLYYEVFVARPLAGEARIRKVACFERRPSDPHCDWLNSQGTAVIWKNGNGFSGDALAHHILGRYLKEFR
jgi:hypothetical protein